MAANLRRYGVPLTTTASTPVVTAVPTARALVVGKLTVTANTAVTVTINVGGQPIAAGIAMTAGQVYSETGLVVLAAETITATASVANACVVSVFGEENDN